MKFIRDIIAEKTQQNDQAKLDSRQDAIEENDFQIEPLSIQEEPEVDLNDVFRTTPDSLEPTIQEIEAESGAETDTEFGQMDDDLQDQHAAVTSDDYDGDFTGAATSNSVFSNDAQSEEELSSPLAPFDIKTDAEDDSFSLGSDTFVATSSFQISGSPGVLDQDNADDDENVFSETIDVAEDEDQPTPEAVLEQAVEALNEPSPFEEPMAAPVAQTPFVPAPMPQPVPAEPEIKDEAITSDPIPQPVVQPIAPQPVDVPAPAVGRGAARAGRVKTRLLGFSPGQGTSPDPFQKAKQEVPSSVTHFPVGWLVISKGPGRGAAYTLFNGVSQIGRGKDQTICLDYGDNSISRESHAAIAYDAETRKFYLGHGGKANLVRLNNRPVLSTEEMQSGNEIRVGETTLHFVSLCGEGFQWNDEQQENFKNAAYS